jgi:hypothetical protein
VVSIDKTALVCKLARGAAMWSDRVKILAWATVFVVYVGLGLHAPAAPVAAEEQVVEHTAKGLPDKDIRVGVYHNVLPDCSSGPLPTIRLVNPPSSGKLTVKKAKASATNYKQCLALEVPAYVAFYRSRPNFSGSDIMTVEVKYPGGRTELQKIIVTIESPAGKGI